VFARAESWQMRAELGLAQRIHKSKASTQLKCTSLARMLACACTCSYTRFAYHLHHAYLYLIPSYTIYIYIYTHTHTCIHTNMYTHTHTNTRTAHPRVHTTAAKKEDIPKPVAVGVVCLAAQPELQVAAFGASALGVMPFDNGFPPRDEQVCMNAFSPQHARTSASVLGRANSTLLSN
jgi:hypothetical protein